MTKITPTPAEAETFTKPVKKKTGGPRRGTFRKTFQCNTSTKKEKKKKKKKKGKKKEKKKKIPNPPKKGEDKNILSTYIGHGFWSRVPLGIPPHEK